MRFRLGLATGYYLGAKAGRRRYDQINWVLARLRRSEAFEVATERARTVVEEGVEKALSVVDIGTSSTNGSDPATPATPGDPGEPRGYSSSR